MRRTGSRSDESQFTDRKTGRGEKSTFSSLKGGSLVLPRATDGLPDSQNPFFPVESKTFPVVSGFKESVCVLRDLNGFSVAVIGSGDLQNTQLSVQHGHQPVEMTA